MKKKELLKRIEALERVVNKPTEFSCNGLHELIEEMQSDPCKPKDGAIYVPDGILNTAGNIVNGKHILSPENESYDVIFLGDDVSKSKPNQFKLVLCKREDLKAGDVAFVYLNEGKVDIKYEVSNLENYMIITDKALVYWDCSGGISVIDYELNSNHVWYKVVEA